MKILFVGAFKNPWSSNVFLEKALKKHGQIITRFDFKNKDKIFKNKKKNLFKKMLYRLLNKISDNHYYPSKLRDLKFHFYGNTKINQYLSNKIMNNRYNLILFAKIDLIDYRLLDRINNISKTWYFFMDPINTAYNVRAFHYAKRCTWCSVSTSALNKLFLKINPNSHYILEGYDPNLFNPGKIKYEKKYDVIFVGSISKIREAYISFLKQNNINVICYGFGWENKPVYLTELVSLYRSSKIILNFPRTDSGFSDRVFQGMGTSTLLLSKYCSDLERIFKKAIHLDWFNSFEEALKLIKFYLKNDDIREKIAESGYKFVKNNYTWDQTAKKIIEIAQK